MSDETVRLELPEEQALVRQFQVQLVEEEGPGALFESRGPRTVIGKDRSSDLVLVDATVSRFHCEMRVEGERIVIQDLNSLNGTYVSGTRIIAAYLGDEAAITLGRCQLRFRRTENEISVPLSKASLFGAMVGESEVMRAAFASLARIARTDATLLLSGESGTGKDLAAESVHQVSSRHEGPFVVVDCGAVPADLMTKELFGVEQGGEDRPGAFERASGGTLFLAEVGKLDLDLQPKLLKVLERGEVVRYLAESPVPIDVRVIAATSGNLREEVNARAFRSDLYFRLAEAEVELPPLRERRDDIPLLVTQILEELGARDSPYIAELRSEAFLDELARPSWPGNVSELKRHMEQCVALGRGLGGAPETGEKQAEPVDVEQPLTVARGRRLEAFEHSYLTTLMQACDNDLVAAARKAGIHRAALMRLLTRHGLLVR